MLPIPFRSKNPGICGWPQLRLNEAELPHYFTSDQQNVGVLLGEPSHDLVDIDLDHPRAVERADAVLPPTPAVFGRASKPRSHRLYRTLSAIKSVAHKSRMPGLGSIVEIRSTGLQTVFPPSTHVSGEAIEWQDEEAEPALIDGQELIQAVKALATQVRRDVGEAVEDLPESDEPLRADDLDPKVSRCLRAMKRMRMVDHEDGSSRLYAAACRAVEHDLDDTQATICIRAYAQHLPFPAQWTDEEVLQRVRDAERRAQRGSVGRISSARVVLIGPDEHRVAQEVLAAMNGDTDLYQRGGSLVTVADLPMAGERITRPAGTKVIRPVLPATLRERLTRIVEFVGVNRKGDEVMVHPPSWLVAAVHARSEWPGIRPLAGIVDAPFLRPDGSICQTEGYDQETGVLYAPTHVFPAINADIGRDAAVSALDVLGEVVADFPFELPEHRAAWLAALMTPLARYAFEGPSPLFLIDANVPGAGKGLLAHVVGRIVEGHDISVASYSHDKTELRKVITTIALAGDRLVLLDNVAGTFGNDSLDRALTTTRWKDRRLGSNDLVDLPLTPVWLATGNNVQVGADTIRRTLHIRLDVLDEHPEHRAGFRHPDLLEWVSTNRPRLLPAALSILAAYHQAGRPRLPLQSFGSFEGWSNLVRQALVWVGLPDPCLSRQRLVEQADNSVEALSALVSAWLAHFGEGAETVLSRLVAELYATEASPLSVTALALRDAIEIFLGVMPGRRPDPRSLGNRLRTVRRRVVSNHYFDVDPRKNRSGAVWRLRSTNKPMECDSASV